MMNSISRMIALLVCAVLLAWPGVSQAASSGTVTGYLKFYQHQGNYCPTTRNCTGAKYLQAQYHTNQPVRYVKVYVRPNSSSTIIGQGTTNGNGYFSINWYYAAGSGNVAAQIFWKAEQKDNRFSVTNSTGGAISFSWGVTLTNGASAYVGTGVWGSAAAPNARANLYDGAQKMWYNSLGQTNRMATYFTGVQIRAFDSSCPTSCAYGSTKIIKIDSEASGYMPQGRVMHEMGHIASYLASRDQSFKWGGDYCYGGTPSPCGWSLSSNEYAAVVFEEGAATNLGDISLYYANAVAPHTCLSSSACSTGSYNIETSLGADGGGSCGATGKRRVINADRYLWDNYDSVSDYAGENLSMGVWHVVDTIHAFDNGTSNRRKDEPWNGDRTALDDRDGRSCIDFRENWITWGTDSSTQLANNCGSAGD